MTGVPPGPCLTLLNCALSAMRRMTLASLRCSSGPKDARKGMSLLLSSLLLFSNWRRFIRCLHKPDRNFCRNLVHLHLHHSKLMTTLASAKLLVCKGLLIVA